MKSPLRSSMVFISILILSSLISAQSESSQVGKGTTGTIPQDGAPVATAHESALSGCLVSNGGNFRLNDDATGTQYALQGNTGNLSGMVGQIVRLSGSAPVRQETGSAKLYQVESASSTGQACSPNHSSSSENASQPGAPANYAQVGPSQADARRIADNAQSTEIGAPGGTYGVNDRTPTTSATQTSSQGASGAIGSAASNGVRSASNNSQTSKIGCLSGANKNWKLQADGTSYALTGAVENMNVLSGHKVQVNGKQNGSSFDVSSVKDVATKCE